MDVKMIRHLNQFEHPMIKIIWTPGQRSGRPCIRGLRISVYDVLSMMSSCMSEPKNLENFPALEMEDIAAVLTYAAHREHKVYTLAVQ
jgi:uncharacterized protein (DUF433 family)